MITLNPTLPPVPAIDASQTTTARKLEYPSELPPSEPQGQCERSRLVTGSALPGDAGTWSIGDPNNPSRDDAMSGSEEAARKNAAAISRDLEKVTAVWHGADCVALYFEGRAYRPC